MKVQKKTVKPYLTTLFNKTGAGIRLALTLHVMKISMSTPREEAWHRTQLSWAHNQDYGSVTLSLVNLLTSVPVWMLKMCSGAMPVSGTAVQLPGSKVVLHSTP